MVSIVCIVALSSCIPACGLEPSTHISQYGYTSWPIGRNGLDGIPIDIAQTADGYIWIGTRNGLYRFDGVRFTRWTPPAGEHLPDEDIAHLLAARDGSLYLGTRAGLARLTRGHLYNYPDRLRWAGPFVEDGAGTLWIGRSGDIAGSSICKIGAEHLSCPGKRNGIDCKTITALASDKPGALWIGSWQGICRWEPNGTGHTFALPRSVLKQDVDVTTFAFDEKGHVWGGVPRAAPKLGLLTFDGGKWASLVTPGVDGKQLSVRTLFLDRRGSLWIGTDREGLYKINDGQIDHFDVKDGLSSNSVGRVFEDRENSLWVVTQRGVDVFRDLPVLSFSSREGFADDMMSAVNAEEPGTVWISTQNSIVRYRDGRIEKVGAGLPEAESGVLFRDSKDQLWVERGQQIFCYRDGQFRKVIGLDGAKAGVVITMTEDTDHQVWASVLTEQTRERALLRMRGLQVVEKVPSTIIAGGQTLSVLAPNPHGGLWIGGYAHGLFWFHDGHSEHIKPDGYDGPVNDLRSEQDGLWVMTNGHGIIWYKDGEAHSLTTKNGLPCDTALDLVDDRSGSHWLHMECGLVRIEDAELAHWRRDRSYQIKTTVFGAFDGVDPEPDSNSSVAPDGSIWSTNGSTIERINPRHLPRNPLPPPVHVERLIVDHEDQPMPGVIRLPVSPRQIEIDYAGLSYVVPQKVQFRYRLIGHDRDWTDAGTRRQAFYNDLRPGHYTFQVIACNNDGVWNYAGDVLNFTVPPACYQTLWFRLLCVVLAAALGYSLYLLRLSRYKTAMKIRFDERLEERTRLARALHDTLLQTLQGMKMVADQVGESVQEPVAKSFAKRISEWSERASREGRAALDSLRNSATDHSDLAAELRRSFDEYCVHCAMGLNLSVTGTSREMHPIVLDEVYRIGDEAIRNACLHSGGRQLNIELVYGENIVLSIRDDGKGIEPGTLQTGKAGHYGLIGMRERATRIGGRITVESSSQGTEIILRVPGKAIYKTASPRRVARLLRRGSTATQYEASE